MTFRYVAMGDSQSEGIGDEPWPDGTPRGWTDRLAGILGTHHADLEYANVAVRGYKAGQVKDTQLAVTLAMRPDLVTISAGMNDILRPKLDADTLRTTLAGLVAPLVEQGSDVLVLPLPDIRDVMPVAKFLDGRITLLNDIIAELVESYGITAFPLEPVSIFGDRRVWTEDRLHLGPVGHQRLAMLAAHALGVDGHAQWNDPLPDPLRPESRAEVARWWVTYVGPWVGRRVRGKSSGDGRTAKRPTPTRWG